MSGTLLMAHLDCFETILTDRNDELVREKASSPESNKVMLQNKLNRFSEWRAIFKD
jgi:hypothetical protein